jgi:hypothetical protein
LGCAHDDMFTGDPCAFNYQCFATVNQRRGDRISGIGARLSSN